MATNYIQKGDNLTVTAPEDVTSGRGLLVSALFGIAMTDALSGAEVVVGTCGVYEHAKTSAQAWTQGVALYWDNTNKVVTSTASGNTKIGVAAAAAANPSATGLVRLNGTF
ncbi:MAG: DUF2190 family protein [Pseudomonadota bacterium]